MKDPAFLFYPNDWMGGTLTLNRHQKGCYIDLLVAQFNNGPLELEEIKIILGADFGQWNSLSKKFSFMNGRYSNPRLEQEKSKRSTFTASRRSNAKAYAIATGEHMEDINKNINTELPNWLNIQAWEKWNKHIFEKKRKKLTPSTIEFQIKKLEKLGIKNHVDVINQAIEKGWVGFFALPEIGQKQNYRQPSKYVEQDDSQEMNERQRELHSQTATLASNFKIK